MRQLHMRLSVAMLVIVSILGSAFYLLDRSSSRLYHEELSQRMATPIGTVKSWIRRSLQRLKRCIDELS